MRNWGVEIVSSDTIAKFDSLSFDDESREDRELQKKRDFRELAFFVEGTRMKKIVSVLLVGIAIFTFAFGRPALAGDAAKGARIFAANCASCHAGGRNLVQANKSLKKADLDKYGMNSLDAIVNQVTKGKRAMPAFKGRLTADKIENVATYVLQQANEKDWK